MRKDGPFAQCALGSLEPPVIVLEVLGGGVIEDDVEEEAASSTVTYAHVSDRSYSLYNALQPV